MLCEKCGYIVLQGTQFCPNCGQLVGDSDLLLPFSPVEVESPQSQDPQEENTPKNRKKLPLAVRIILRIVSFLLSVCLIASLIATALVLDMRQLMNQNQMENVLDSLLQERFVPENPLLAQGVGVDAAENLGREMLTDWIYGVLESAESAELPITQEQLGEFLEQSTADEFLVSKVSGFAADFVNGTQNTTLDKTEVLTLLDENAQLMEDVLHIKLDSEVKQKISEYLDQADFESLIRQEIFGKMEDAQLMEGYTVGNLLSDLRRCASTAVLLMLVWIDAMLIFLLVVTHRFRLGASLRSVGVAGTVAGVVLALPVIVLQSVPAMLEAAGVGAAAGVLQVLVSAVAPVHYTICGLGVATLLAGVVCGILRIGNKK